jgi:hypothetical protein
MSNLRPVLALEVFQCFEQRLAAVEFAVAAITIHAKRGHRSKRLNFLLAYIVQAVQSHHTTVRLFQISIYAVPQVIHDIYIQFT